MFLFQQPLLSPTRVRFVVALFLWTTIFCNNNNAYAQLKLTNSPYSRVAIGSMQPTQFAIQRAMGGVSVPYASSASINYSNPASYPALKLMTMEIGLQANGTWLANTTQQSMTGSGMINYFALAFPCAKFWATSIGLLPYSSLHYDINTQKYSSITDTLLTTHRFIGKGSFYQAYWGNGFKYKRLSLGINIAYIFGEQNRLAQSYFPEVAGSYGNQKDEAVVAHGFAWNLGTQYDLPFKNKKYHLIIAATANAATNIKVDKDGKWTRFIAASNTEIDSIYQYQQVKGNLQMPIRAAFGLALKQDNKWQIAADYRNEQWTNFRNFDQPDSALVNSQQFALGLEYTPDYRAITKFWQSTSYRGGFRYNTGRINIYDTHISDWAITMGVGMPLRKTNSRINLAIEIGQQGKAADQLIRETFLIATFGFTLNDRWFIKPKYD